MAGPNGSYYGEYMRSTALHKHVPGGPSNAKALLTDRNAYISFLEVQLERVSAACLTTQTFEKRMLAVENTQLVADEKLSSLSKVLRLNQEYVEQTSEQTRAEVVKLIAQTDAWRQQNEQEAQRVDHQLRSYDLTINRIQEQRESDCASTERDLDDLKTLVMADTTRIEAMQQTIHDTDEQVDYVKLLVTQHLDKEFECVRRAVSEKTMRLEAKFQQLSDIVEKMSRELEHSWKNELFRLNNSHKQEISDLRNRVECEEARTRDGVMEMKEVMRKCLDTQHLLSSTVVAIQNDVDEQRHTHVASSEARSAIDDLRENQFKLKEALKILQTCTQDTQQSNEDNCADLANRLEVAEENFARLAQESFAKADDLRDKMLVALGEVEQQLRKDADMVAEQAVHSVQLESEAQFTEMKQFTSSVESRLRSLERSLSSLAARIDQIVQIRNANESEYRFPKESSGSAQEKNRQAHGTNDSDTSNMAKVTESWLGSIEEKMRGMVMNIQRDAVEQESREKSFKTRIFELEEQLHRKSQQEEEHRAILDQSDGKRISSSSQKSCTSTSSTERPRVMPSRQLSRTKAQPDAVTKTKRISPKPSTQRVAISQSVGVSSKNVKSKRLKELCMELIALEKSCKDKASRAK